MSGLPQMLFMMRHHPVSSRHQPQKTTFCIILFCLPQIRHVREIKVTCYKEEGEGEDKHCNGMLSSLWHMFGIIIMEKGLRSACCFLFFSSLIFILFGCTQDLRHVGSLT